MLMSTSQITSSAKYALNFPGLWKPPNYAESLRSPSMKLVEYYLIITLGKHALRSETDEGRIPPRA